MASVVRKFARIGRRYEMRVDMTKKLKRVDRLTRTVDRYERFLSKAPLACSELTVVSRRQSSGQES